MTKWIDTHAHLYDPDLALQLAEVLQRAQAANVSHIITVGTGLGTSRRCCRDASEHPMLFAAVGIHPNHVHEAREGDWDKIVELAHHPRVRGIGETGIDYYWKEAPPDLQRDYFLRHLELGRKLDLPVIIHVRESSEAVLSCLKIAAEKGPVRGVMHSFTGNWEEAQACIKLGLHISFAGMVTFKKSETLREVAAKIPDDRLLVETDCPYLSPEPFRGKRPNEPARVVHTGQCVAQARGVSPVQLAEQTTANAMKLFRLAE